ncbi:unnamed protein product, partial [Iphiclides podalirius]
MLVVPRGVLWRKHRPPPQKYYPEPPASIYVCGVREKPGRIDNGHHYPTIAHYRVFAPESERVCIVPARLPVPIVIRVRPAAPLMWHHRNRYSTMATASGNGRVSEPPSTRNRQGLVDRHDLSLADGKIEICSLFTDYNHSPTQ